MYRREFLSDLRIGGAIAVALSLAGCVGLGSSGAAPVDVDETLIKMTDDNRFEPDAISVPVGERVIWRNVGYAPHTVTAYQDEIPPSAIYFASGDFTSEAAARNGASTGDGILRQGDQYDHTFEVPGTYAYYCIPHEQAGMTGVVTVSGPTEVAQGGA